ncbi:MAG: hypothetical protein JWM56_1011 [Candidatus Peribacteria bacterium]|nr:hypothetical protein [Candidatus Peribacteria bacterium]
MSDWGMIMLIAEKRLPKRWDTINLGYVWPTFPVRFCRDRVTYQMPARAQFYQTRNALFVELGMESQLEGITITCKTLESVPEYLWKMTDTQGREWLWAPGLNNYSLVPVQPGESFVARVYWYRVGLDIDCSAPSYELVASCNGSLPQRWVCRSIEDLP